MLLQLFIEKTTLKKIVLIALITLVIGLIVWVIIMKIQRNTNTPRMKYTMSSPLNPFPATLDPLKCTIELGRRPYGTRYIIGTIENSSDANYSLIYIVINLLDHKGEIIGTTGGIAGYSSAHQTCKFHIPINMNGISSVKVRSISALVEGGAKSLNIAEYDHDMEERAKLITDETHVKKDILVQNIAIGRGTHDMGYIIGNIFNNSSIMYAYAYIQMDLCNDKGEIIEKTNVTVYDLEQGCTYKFHSPYSDTTVSSIKVHRVTGSR